jgi:flagellar biosynthesis chaperone FliJ
MSPNYNEFLKSLENKIQDQLKSLNKFKTLLEEQNRVEFNPYVNFSN